eukprot:scaffold135640_cov23-Tisochrysis_lutea.AAC.1
MRARAGRTKPASLGRFFVEPGFVGLAWLERLRIREPWCLLVEPKISCSAHSSGPGMVRKSASGVTAATAAIKEALKEEERAAQAAVA